MKKIIFINLKNSNKISNFILYFTFYSFMGFCFETIFGIFSKGVIESRKSFLFGPFCAIYGIAALVMLVFLRKYRNSWPKVFTGALIIGTISEYFMSLFFEKVFHFKWWDYSNYFLNINGRTCLFFACIWGLLGLFLIKVVDPKMAKFINFIKNKFSNNTQKLLIKFILVFFIFDMFVSTLALKNLYEQISLDFFNLPNSSYKLHSYLKNIKLFSVENMIKLYPNIQLAGSYMNNVYVDSLYNVPPSYYIKVFK